MIVKGLLLPRRVFEQQRGVKWQLQLFSHHLQQVMSTQVHPRHYSTFWIRFSFSDSNLTDKVRFAIKLLVKADLANDNSEEANRASITNKHDKARLLYLRKDPTDAAL